MIRAIVVVPSAPVLLPGLAGRLPQPVETIHRAAVAELSAILRSDSDCAVLAAPVRVRDRDPAAGAKSGATAQVEGAVRGSMVGEPVSAVPLGWDVGKHLLECAGARPPITWRTPDDDLPSCDVLVAAASGAATVGDRSPRADAIQGGSDARFDDAIAGALASGRLSALAGLTDTDAARVGCFDAGVWRTLARLGDGWTAGMSQRSHPLGVTYFVTTLIASAGNGP